MCAFSCPTLLLPHTTRSLPLGHLKFSCTLLACSRMIILDNQARQQMTRHFLIVTLMQRFAHHRLRQVYRLYAWRSPWWAKRCCIEVTIKKWRVICWRAWSSKIVILLSTPACLITFMTLFQSRFNTPCIDPVIGHNCCCSHNVYIVWRTMPNSNISSVNEVTNLRC